MRAPGTCAGGVYVFLGPALGSEDLRVQGMRNYYTANGAGADGCRMW